MSGVINRIGRPSLGLDTKTSSGSSKITNVSTSDERSILKASGHSMNPLPVGTSNASSKGGIPIDLVLLRVKNFHLSHIEILLLFQI